MSQVLGVHPFRRKQYRTLALLCDDEPLSDAQLKSYQTKLQEYRTFLDSVSRLALCGNVCVTEEVVTIGEHGLLTGESLNALQHAGAISVYNTLQQNNWEFPVSEGISSKSRLPHLPIPRLTLEGEVAVVKSHNPIPDEFLDSEKPIRSDWPAVHISECFVEGERAKLHGSVRPLRTFLPPTIVFRNAADVDEDIPEPELNVPSGVGADGNVELVSLSEGITVKKTRKDGKGTEYIPLEEYFFGRQEGNTDYYEEKGDYCFKCAVCQRMFYSNIKLMSHLLGHVDESSQAGLDVAHVTQCRICEVTFPTAFDLRNHMNQEHVTPNVEDVTTGTTVATVVGGMEQQFVAQTASQLLMQQRIGELLNTTTGTTMGMDGSGIMQQTTTATTTTTTIVSTTASNWNCRICDKDANSELALAHHLQSTHRQREMPYVCRLCLFRSSVFEDILSHFKKFHENSNHLLCTYCLRIFTPSDARSPQLHMGLMSSPGVGVGQTQVYLQHLRMHQVRHQLRRCPTCKLNFTNKSDYQVHRRLDHKASRAERLDEGQDSFEGAHNASGFSQSADQAVQHMKDTQPHITLMNAPEAGRVKSLADLRMPNNIENISCLECVDCIGSESHKHYLSCSMCRFGTCCSTGYNRHLSRVHVYISGDQPTEPDTSMPMDRAVYFQWIADEVAQLEPLIETADCGELAMEDENMALTENQTEIQPSVDTKLAEAPMIVEHELLMAQDPVAVEEAPIHMETEQSIVPVDSIDTVGTFSEGGTIADHVDASVAEVNPEEIPVVTLDPELTSVATVDQDKTPIADIDEEDVPTAVVDQENTPVTIADQENVPAVAVDQEDMSAVVIDQEDVPKAVIDQEDVLAATIDQEGITAVATDQEGIPTLATEQENVPAAVIDQEHVLVAIEGQEDAIVASVDKEDVLATDSDQADIPVTAEDEKNPLVTATEQENSAVAVADSENAPMTDAEQQHIPIDSEVQEGIPMGAVNPDEVADLLPSDGDISAIVENVAKGQESIAVAKTLEEEAFDQNQMLAQLQVNVELEQLRIVNRYMESRLDAREFACMQCAITNLNGNSLARHLVEECGSTTVTLNPNPELVKARLEAEEQYRLQQEQQQHEETAILFEPGDANLSGQELSAVGQAGGDDDVVMVNMEADQFTGAGASSTSYGLIDGDGAADGGAAAMATQLMAPVGTAAGTTIDVTDASGEVVQQFIIPHDLQLEEGQTLVMIHDEDGQPQLAIVNQADLIDPNNTQMIVQSEEEEANNMLMYSNQMTDQAPVNGMVIEREDEKENNQFAL